MLRGRGGNVALITALLLPLLLLFVGGSVDTYFILNTQSHLQDATNSTGLTISATVAANPNATEATLKSMAQATLSANLSGSSLTGFHVCSQPIQNDCTSNGVAMANHTVALTTSATSPCFFFNFVGGVCNGNSGRVVNAQATTTIGYAKTLQINMALDTSASMIVGATQADVNDIATWVQKNWSSVEPNCNPNDLTCDTNPCAFACHDGGSDTRSDIALGLTNAHAAGATTRFDVMISAAKGLITHIQQEATTNPLLTANTYVFNVFGLDSPYTTPASGKIPAVNNTTGVTQYGASNISYSQAQTALGTVNPGLDTHMSTAMTQIISTMGSSGNGTSSTSPLKFLILVTDGLQSDRSSNWNCSQVTNGPWAAYDQANPPASNIRKLYPQWAASCTTNSFAQGISASQCTQLKNNGIVLAVLETPYVPLNGQSPTIRPYEKTVRGVIYPSGPTGPSAISTALQNCASTGYYFQASSSSDIATGFTTLTDKFIFSTPYVAH